MTGVLTKERSRETGDTEVHKEKVKCAGRNWSYLCSLQPRNTEDYQQPPEARRETRYGVFLRASGGIKSAFTLIFFWNPE